MTKHSELDSLIPPEIISDELWHIIKAVASQADVKTILEIGSSSGEGSTSAVVQGALINPSKPKVFCLEVSKPRFQALQKRYANYPFVFCYNASSVSLDDFPTEQEIVDFYSSHQSALNNYPLERVIGWLRQDIAYIKDNHIEQNAIDLIKKQHEINHFDMVIIDGSEFTGPAEFKKTYGAKFFLLDDINGYKNFFNFKDLLSDRLYRLVLSNSSLRNGYAVFQFVGYSGIKDYVEAIEGFMMKGQERFLFEKAFLLPNDAKILEIGSFKGRSTVAMGYACKGSHKKIYCVDTWSGNDSDFKATDFYEEWFANISKNNLTECVIAHRGKSSHTLKQLRRENIYFEMAFIDGSHQYLDVLEDFENVYAMTKEGGLIALHDVIYTWHGPFVLWHGIAKHILKNHEFCHSISSGIKDTLSTLLPPIPIHFFTIVLNGMPFIRHHIEVFRHLPFKWHWHIIEGVADLKHDTAWSLKRGAKITDELHSGGLSNDGTTEYLDTLKKLYPDNITIYRKPNGEFWDGKLEMVNAPLANIHNECLLFQIDADELWTIDQLCAVQWMFRQYPEKTAAYYYCYFFVGENLVTITKNTYGNHTSYEWLRTWRFKPGDFWLSHEPPRLCRSLEGKIIDVASINPFTHLETEYRGLIFQHFAYVTEQQLRFKELYYGYHRAVESWLKLQENQTFSVFLKDYFSWVTDNTMISTATSEGISPLANRFHSQWQFNLFSSSKKFTHAKNILWVRTDSIGDSILNMFMLPYIKERFNNAKITVLCQNHIKELYEPCPVVDEIITFDKDMAYTDEGYRNNLIKHLLSKGFDLVINPIHSSEELTHLVAISSTIKDKIAFEGDLCNIRPDNKKLYMPHYTHLIKTSSLLELNRNIEFIQALGIAPSNLSAEIWLTQVDIDFAEEFFKKHKLEGDKTIALFAGAQWEVRLYNQYGVALLDICKLYGFDVIALGSDKDFEINEQNLKDTQARYFNLSGKTTLRQAAAIMSKCRLAVGAETGLAHIACAVETPNVILLGGGHFGRFMPYSQLTTVVCLPLECYWCNWGGCKYEQNYCINDIMPNVMTMAILETLRTSSDKARVFMQGRSLYNETPAKPKWQDCAKFLTGNVSLIQVDTNATEPLRDNKSN